MYRAVTGHAATFLLHRFGPVFEPLSARTWSAGLAMSSAACLEVSFPSGLGQSPAWGQQVTVLGQHAVSYWALGTKLVLADLHKEME